MKGHRPTIDERVLQCLEDNPGVWLTSAQVAKLVGTGTSRDTGRRISLLQEDNPHIEIWSDERKGKRYYRYCPGRMTA